MSEHLRVDRAFTASKLPSGSARYRADTPACLLPLPSESVSASRCARSAYATTSGGLIRCFARTSGDATSKHCSRHRDRNQSMVIDRRHPSAAGSNCRCTSCTIAHRLEAQLIEILHQPASRNSPSPRASLSQRGLHPAESSTLLHAFFSSSPLPASRTDRRLPARNRRNDNRPVIEIRSGSIQSGSESTAGASRGSFIQRSHRHRRLHNRRRSSQRLKSPERSGPPRPPSAPSAAFLVPFGPSSEGSCCLSSLPP